MTRNTKETEFDAIGRGTQQRPRVLALSAALPADRGRVNGGAASYSFVMVTALSRRSRIDG